MRLFAIPFSIVAMAAVSGCGGGSSSLGSASKALNYTPSYSDGPTDTAAASLLEPGGVTGTLHRVDVIDSRAGLTSIKIRLSADRSIAYVSIGGGREVALNGQAGTFDAGGGAYGDPSSLYISLSNTPNYSLVGYVTDELAGFGFAGIETTTANLPTGDAIYSGFWGGQIYPDLSGILGGGIPDPEDLEDLYGGVAGGFVDMTINFETGNISGSFDGDFNVGPLDPVATTGTITGSAEGNGIIGKFVFDPGLFNGSADFVAKAYGDDGSEIAGVIGDTLTNTITGDKQAFGGTLTMDLD